MSQAEEDKDAMHSRKCDETGLFFQRDQCRVPLYFIKGGRQPAPAGRGQSPECAEWQSHGELLDREGQSCGLAGLQVVKEAEAESGDNDTHKRRTGDGHLS